MSRCKLSWATFKVVIIGQLGSVTVPKQMLVVTSHTKMRP